MEKLRAALSRLPQWVLTAATTLLILWLTLAPDPLGDDAPTLFPGADKIVHAIMFGFLTTMILLDTERKRGWIQLPAVRIVSAAVASALLGALIEVAQLEMEMGRGFEWADMAADATGAALCGCGWKMLQRHWSVN
jgi:VanZ family protein